jgi:ATP-binding cassette subfamily B protein
MAVTSTEPSPAGGTSWWRRLLGANTSALVANISRAVVLVWRSSPGWTVANIVMILVDAGLPILLLLAFKEIIDATTAAAGGPDPEATLRGIMPALAFAVGVAVVQAAAKAIGRLATDAQSLAVTDYMIGLLQRHAVAIDLRYFEDTTYRNMLHRAQREAPFRPARILGTLLDVGRSALSLGAMLAVLISFHWAVIPALLLAGLPGGLARLVFAGRLHRLHVRQTEDTRRASYYESLLMGLANAQEVRLLALGQHFGDLSRSLRKQLRLDRLNITKARLGVEFFAEAVAVATMFGLIALLCWQALVGIITLSGLVMYVQALQRCWGNFSQLVLRAADLREHSLFIDDVYQFLDLKPTILPPALPKPTPTAISQGITIKDLCFRYPGSDEDALHNVSMTIRAGEHVAIVGHNGSGKTTLIKLLCRVYDPQAGSIAIDGIDLRDMDPEALRRLYSVHV